MYYAFILRACNKGSPKNIKVKTKNCLATKEEEQTDIIAKYCKIIFYKTTTPIPNISRKQAIRKIKNRISSGSDEIHRVYNVYVEYIESSFIFARYVKDSTSLISREVLIVVFHYKSQILLGKVYGYVDELMLNVAECFFHF